MVDPSYAGEPGGARYVQENLGTWREGAWTRRRLAALAARDATCWAFALPWLLETVERFPTPLAHLMAA